MGSLSNWALHLQDVGGGHRRGGEVESPPSIAMYASKERSNEDTVTGSPDSRPQTPARPPTSSQLSKNPDTDMELSVLWTNTA